MAWVLDDDGSAARSANGAVALAPCGCGLSWCRAFLCRTSPPKLLLAASNVVLDPCMWHARWEYHCRGGTIFTDLVPSDLEVVVPCLNQRDAPASMPCMWRGVYDLSSLGRTIGINEAGSEDCSTVTSLWSVTGLQAWAWFMGTPQTVQVYLLLGIMAEWGSGDYEGYDFNSDILTFLDSGEALPINGTAWADGLSTSMTSAGQSCIDWDAAGSPAITFNCILACDVDLEVTNL